MDKDHHLLIQVLDAWGFKGSDGDDLPDTYAVLNANGTRFVSRVCRKELRPCWREAFLLRHEEVAAAGRVLLLELWAVRRWGADALLGQAEVTLDELPALVPGQPPLSRALPLVQPTKGTARSRGSQAAECGTLRVEVSAVQPPPAPAAPLAGSGSTPTATPTPVALATCASLLAAHCPVVHTPLGELYEVPPVQLIQLTIHRAEGLHNLNVEPATAGSSPRGRLAGALRNTPSSTSQRTAGSSFGSSSSAAGGSSSSASLGGGGGGVGVGVGGTSEAAAAAAAAAQQLREKSSALLNKTSDWFKKQKTSRFGAGAAAVLATMSTPTASGSSFGGSGSPPSFLGTSPNTTAAGVSPRASTDSLDAPLLAIPGASDTAAMAAGAGESSVPGGSDGGASDVQTAGTSPASAAALDLTSLNPNQQQQQQQLPASYPSSSAAAAAATRAVGTFPSAGHERVGSVDASVVLSGLEELGFHATDAPGGSFFYIKAALQGQTDAGVVSRMVALAGVGGGGGAVWEEAFLLAAPRPAEACAKLELELYAAPDKKQRGRMVCHVEESLAKLLDPAAAGPGSSTDCVRSEMVLIGHFSQHLYCRIWVTLEVVDEGHRAAARQLPRVSPAAASQQAPSGRISSGSAASSGGMHLATSALPSGVMAPPPPRSSIEAALAKSPSASAPPPGDARSASPAATAASPTGTSLSSPAALQLPKAAVPIAAAVAAAVATDVTASGQQQQILDKLTPDQQPSTSDPASTGNNTATDNKNQQGQQQSQQQQGAGGDVQAAAGPVQRAPAADALAALGCPFSEAQTLAALELLVDGFELDKPADCFFVLQLGPYWAVSSTQHSSGRPLWRWQLQLPVTDPGAVLSLALYKREDQKEGKKVVSMRAVFSDALTLIGKLRIRLSTLAPNQPISLKLPLSGERTNLKAGPVAAAHAKLQLRLHVPRVLGTWLKAYGQVPVWPPLYLLAARSGESFTIEAATSAAQRVALKWLEEQSPGVPPKVGKRVLDDGCAEFTLSRTIQNWRRLIALHASLAPASAAFAHICSWDSPLHSGAVVSAILLFGLFPSHMLALAAVAAAAGLWRLRRSRKAQGIWAQPPPMEGDDVAPEDGNAASTTSVAAPTDAYTALKQNYDGVMAFAGTVQNVLDGWAASGERLQALVSWSDPVASSVLLGVLLLLASGLWLLGLRVLVTFGMLWTVRPPALRDPYPPPPNNFLMRLPTRGDTLM